MKLVQIAMHHIIGLTAHYLVNIIVVFLIHLRIGRWEGRVDVLRCEFVLGSIFHVPLVDVRLFQRAILIESATDKVGRVRKVR